jgi:hypothetical protein
MSPEFRPCLFDHGGFGQTGANDSLEELIGGEVMVVHIDQEMTLVRLDSKPQIGRTVTSGRKGDIKPASRYRSPDYSERLYKSASRPPPKNGSAVAMLCQRTTMIGSPDRQTKCLDGTIGQKGAKCRVNHRHIVTRPMPNPTLEPQNETRRQRKTPPDSKTPFERNTSDRRRRC